MEIERAEEHEDEDADLEDADACGDVWLVASC